MKNDRQKIKVMRENRYGQSSELPDEETGEAMLYNLLITAALTRSCLQRLSSLLPEQAQLYNSASLVMAELMQFASSETGLSHILSIFDLMKTLSFTFQGSLKIFSDEVGIGVGLVDTELEVKATDLVPYNPKGDTLH